MNSWPLLFSLLVSGLVHYGVVVALLALKLQNEVYLEKLEIDLFIQNHSVTSGSQKSQGLEQKKAQRNHQENQNPVELEKVDNDDSESYVESQNSNLVDKNLNYFRQRAVEDALQFIGLYLEYPEEAKRRGWQGRVVVRVTITKDGQLQGVEVAESSGYRVLDRAAVHLLAQVEHFSHQINEELRLLVPVDYIL